MIYIGKFDLFRTTLFFPEWISRLYTDSWRYLVSIYENFLRP